ncbi:hypothetical protein Zm00014a_024272 [Zea mays]|jgi:hypothetical protein|uniref:Uncharacterized protein n=2 Tax=Zea mays TaxID=4577 RepID=K7VP54_MAIZE|nr:uncharacterized protein LOC100277941 [Zea mays]AQK99878.1 hypothetical protein ZEAMMB73_Zm00001d012563 [Zea mays]PWZ11849.1 hypothetical protein Zm00014a_024272 [Zea mays]|eukprot:NP_001144853.2 uncharacterized protein LOC100277941 [Zea mays]
MAAEAQAEGRALPRAPPPPLARGGSSASPEKRGLPIPGFDGVAEEEEERVPEPKRRRAWVAALDSAVAGCGGDGDGGSFSFQHAPGCFVAPEATPKFGSFNPPGDQAELAGLDPKPVGREADAEDSPEAGDEVSAASAPGAEAKDERLMA